MYRKETRRNIGDYILLTQYMESCMALANSFMNIRVIFN